MPLWHMTNANSSINMPIRRVAENHRLTDSATVELAKRIGANIKAVREARGLSLEKVAARVRPPTAYTTISRFEKGERSLTFDWLERIAAALEVDPIDLVSSAQPPLRQMSEPVASEMAQTLARVVLGGGTPERGTVQVLALMLQELAETFSRHPEAFADPAIARPVLELTARRSASAAH